MLLLPMKWGAGSMSILSPPHPTPPRVKAQTVPQRHLVMGEGFRSGTFPAVHPLHLHEAAALKKRKKQGVGDRRFSVKLQVSSLVIIVRK